MSAIENIDFRHTELLRFITCGSVDDGKSTLIGRLLHDTCAIAEDLLAAVARSTRRRGLEGIDLSLLTDGLTAEREQGITIDVAYRYFATPRRKFIIADTPGHEQYTRNMATGASTANLAVVLVDARKGVLTQSRRHAFIAGLLGIPHVVLAVNKMDLVDWSPEVFQGIRDEFAAFAADLGLNDVTAIPLSALLGDMVVERGGNLDWYAGPTLLEFLESVEIDHDVNTVDFRFPVQWVCRPGAGEHADFRGYAGRVESGEIAAGDAVKVLPSGVTTRVQAIHTYDGPLSGAHAAQSVMLLLADPVDISRGDVIVKASDELQPVRDIEATLVWFGEQPLDPRRRYLLKHGTRTVKAQVGALRHRVNVNTLERETGVAALGPNEIGLAALRVQQPLALDPYRRNRAAGSFILMDETTHNTVAAGMAV
ncbi:MAG TPA: sulfate adenylyltransferase subunit CysN [Burkholderiales bacterium]|nr:sulfate adenylyltransferase subunit CysN [Burkholderiales bacterium]